MLKVTDKRVLPNSEHRAIGNIPIGTVFSGQIEGYDPGIFLRAFDCVINLADPRETWTSNATFEDYCPVDAELIVKAK